MVEGLDCCESTSPSAVAGGSDVRFHFFNLASQRRPHTGHRHKHSPDAVAQRDPFNHPLCQPIYGRRSAARNGCRRRPFAGCNDRTGGAYGQVCSPRAWPAVQLTAPKAGLSRPALSCKYRNASDCCCGITTTLKLIRPRWSLTFQVVCHLLF